MVRSAKKPKDQNAPKRPLSAYFLFVGENRASYVKKNPDMSVTEVMKGMAAAWSNLSDAAKKPYEKSADKSREAYTKKREKYVMSTSYKKHQAAVKEWKKAQGNKPFRKDANRPKRPASAYLLFVNAERPGMMKDGLSVTEVASKAAKMWKRMGAGEKEKWEKKANSAKSKYAKEIAAYEKSSKYKQYMKEKEAYESQRNEKRKAERSSSSAPPKKKARRAASVPKAPSTSRSVSRSRSRRRSVSRRSSVPKSRSRSRRRASVPRASKKGKAKSRSRARRAA
jgi:hypothetical protein